MGEGRGRVGTVVGREGQGLPCAGRCIGRGAVGGCGVRGTRTAWARWWWGVGGPGGVRGAGGWAAPSSVGKVPGPWATSAEVEAVVGRWVLGQALGENGGNVTPAPWVGLAGAARHLPGAIPLPIASPGALAGISGAVPGRPDVGSPDPRDISAGSAPTLTPCHGRTSDRP